MPAKLCPICKEKHLTGRHKDYCQRKLPGFWLVYYANLVLISKQRGSECSYIDDLSSAVISLEEYKRKMLQDPLVRKEYERLKSQTRPPNEGMMIAGFEFPNMGLHGSSDGKKISAEDWDKWKKDQDRQWHCVFCGDHGNFDHFWVDGMFGCAKCREFKGMEPCVPSSCDWGGG
jgi:hypothetical protein